MAKTYKYTAATVDKVSRGRRVKALKDRERKRERALKNEMRRALA
jgi:hypothetical protein